MKMRTRLTALLMLVSALPAFAHANFRGYSGAPGRETCAESCHGTGTGSVVVSGFPANYVPGQTYTVSIYHTDGSSIANFNGSVRQGTVATNAGTIASGTNTTTYNVTGETNGVHFTSANHDSGNFTWTAPIAGTGGVTLYVGAHQSNIDGPNTTIVTASAEGSALPEAASNPSPALNAADVLPAAVLSWTAGTGATSHDLFFGTTNPPAAVGNQTATSFDPPGLLTAGTVYYWRVDERNDMGATTGALWQFTTLSLPEAAANPGPANNATEIGVDTFLTWSEGQTTTFRDVYFGTSNPPGLVETDFQETRFPVSSLLPDMVYFWRIDEKNAAGITQGPVWQFRTAPVSAAGDRRAAPTAYALEEAYPNPFNSTVTIPFIVKESSPVQVLLYDDMGRRVAVLANGTMSAGAHTVQWNSANASTGTYFVTMIAGKQVLTQKITALK
jgi:hypothetical protein